MFIYSAELNTFRLHDETQPVPDGFIAITDEEHNTLMRAQLDGKQIAPGKDGKPVAVDRSYSPEEVENMFNAAVNNRLTVFANERQYDSIQNAMLMMESAAFQADGQAAYTAYDATWQAAIALMPQVSGGALSIDAALSQLPALTWPEG